jgi:hypothetical protein
MNKILLLSILFLSGCSYATFYVPSERLVYQPTNPGSVGVSTQETVTQNYKVLGTVAAITWGSGDDAREKLQEQAALIGANLVIKLRIEHGFWRTSASGLAVLVYQGDAPN